MITQRKTHPLIKIINNSLVDLPAPINISAWWNFGSLLGVCLGTQIITGLFLAIHYTNDVSIAFNRIIHITRDVNNGWLIRTLHANGASFFFICIYLHVGRGIYYASYRYQETWLIGVILLFFSFWGCFLRVCPSMRPNIILGGYRHHQSSISRAIFWGIFSPVSLRRIRYWQRNLNPIFLTSLYHSFYYFSLSHTALTFFTSNRIK